MLIVDTEDNSRGDIYWINFYDGRRHYPFKNRSAAISFLERSKQNEIWAVNLEYDLINIFWGNLKRLKLCFGKSRLVKANFGKKVFYDTLNHWKMSVANMGDYLGLPKKKFNPLSLKYCQRDCEITYKFVSLMKKNYRRIGMAKIYSTISLSSFMFWKTYSSYKLRKVREDVLLDLKNAYYGGRVECFYIGNKRGNIKYVDVNSMYPACMIGTFPSPRRLVKSNDIDKPGVSYVRVKSDLRFPVLPYRREDNKVIFPNGRFRGWWANEELEFAVSQGVKILKFYRGYEAMYECRPFDNYIGKLYFERKKAKDDLLKYTYKIFMNSLYGKFAQGNERSIIEPIEKFRKRKNWDRGKVFEDDRLVLLIEKGKYPIHTNFLFSLYTTARARIRLYKLIKDIHDKGGDILYCDTDSVIFDDTAGISLNYDNELGGIKLEGTFNSINIKTCKFYKLDKSIKIKGIPKLYQELFFDKDEVIYKKPLKLKEAIRRDLRPNVWIDFKKVKILNYDKGIILKSGYVEPVKLYN